MTGPVLNRRLVLEAKTRVPDGAGGYSESWSSLGQMWAELRSPSGRERSGAGSSVSAVRYRIFVRAAPQGSASRPEPGQRFRDGLRVFAIRAVADEGTDGRHLMCFADEEVAL